MKNQKESPPLFVGSNSNEEEFRRYRLFKAQMPKGQWVETSILVQKMGRAGPRASNALLKHVGSRRRGAALKLARVSAS
ncbi:hypothetical protein ES319_A02G104600v1 [Gossypium barbadense]|uniref:Uncharacterized protein n=2 Tax=Gossypium TaxID=3633 RepID=A0A5J5WP94_GOSBA|nr:hypothetical protein ES319_A02G104600v1 [Gossypium barbadense]TYH28068.1 hypothetical protein ES288_A02G115100v1 [Gossypium darwinii]